jgi:hypothetical protein
MRNQLRGGQSGQAIVLVAVALLALIGSAALVLLAGSVTSQRNQLQTLADSAALDSALKIGVGCTAAKASIVITEADNFLATQRTRSGALAIAAGTCATPYHGTDAFTGGLSADYYYPYQAHQQQVEVVLTLALPIAFGAEVGKSSTTVTRYAVAQALPASLPAVSSTSLTCAGGQVNIAGSVVASSPIARTGTCALYAHTRFDAASGTYSDLGNVSVYTDGQSWTAPGTCVAGANAGSSGAICADGYELSGHVSPACAGASTSYLSAGDKVINANPCAAGTGPQPVATLVANRPPEPNQDPAAITTLQGTGGAACAPGGVYPNILVGGVTVATGLAPAPVKDAGGFYHFKPSCYGYLNPSSLTGAGGGITNRQVGAEAGPTTKTITPSLAAASAAGTLLVVDITSQTSASDKPFTAPANWVQAVTVEQDGAAHTDIWYYPDNPGGITSATFGISPASINVEAQMTEWSGVALAAPLDQTGTAMVAAAGKNATISTSGATSSANELVITNVGFNPQGAGNTYTPGAGWNSLTNDPTNGFSSEYRTDLPAAVASETVHYVSDTTWALVVATFKSAGGGGGGSGAVLDPGFYYFNGSGFAGGGGICLNGGTLLARDVTLEFVNQAGFSSGTCAAGGGASCTAPCRFGSTPCSVSACPPNAGADSPNNLTWFAAPCSSSSAADAASCLGGSSWCPTGDRSCWDELIWAPATNNGQVALTGSSATAWLLGSIDWPGTCAYQANGTSTISGRLYCGTLSISAAAGAGTAVGSDYGINTAIAEAVLVE